MFILTTYPENSSSEEGSLNSSTASESCFLEVFSGCLCAVDVRAGWCRPLPIQLLSNKELDPEPSADTRLTCFSNSGFLTEEIPHKHANENISREIHQKFNEIKKETIDISSSHES